MKTIRFYCSRNQPGATLVDRGRYSPAWAYIDLPVDPEWFGRGDEVDALARWLAEHLATNCWGATGERALRGVFPRVLPPEYGGGTEEYSIEWSFDFFAPNKDPHYYLREQARRLLREFHRSGHPWGRLETNGSSYRLGGVREARPSWAE